MRDPFLQDYVVPICQAEISGHAKLTRLEGTAFFINPDGVFLTAAHVLRAIAADSSGLTWGLNLKGLKSGDNFFAPLGETELAPVPFDIGIGRVPHNVQSWLTPCSADGVRGWRDVATLGYPASALNTTPGKFNIHLRLLKGYIQREINEDELPVHQPHPHCYELSFAIPNGLSGSPLFIPHGNDQQLIGVCVTSIDVEIVIDSFTEIDDDGKRFSEKRARVEQYGLAHSILPLWDWRPKLLKGKSLREAMAPSSGRVTPFRATSGERG
jgi:hypothetical protein